MEWMILPLKRYAQFGGRSRRKEYWMWILFVVIASIVAGLLDTALGLGGQASTSATRAPGMVGYNAGLRGGMIANVFAIATLVPNISVAVRRLHDTNHSGWWLLLLVLPYAIAFALLLGGAAAASPLVMLVGGLAALFGFIGAIVLLVWYCTAGTPGPNRYGEDPKGDIPADLARTFE